MSRGPSDRARRAARLAADPSIQPHGTVNTYREWGCRCGRCRAANVDSKRDEARSALPARDRHPSEVSPRAITGAERPYVGLSPRRHNAVLRQLLDAGASTPQVAGLSQWLWQLGQDPALALAMTSTTTRSAYRRLLEQHRPAIPPERRRGAEREAGFLSLGLGTVVAGTGLAATGHPAAGLALVGSLVITTAESEPVEELLAAA